MFMSRKLNKQHTLSQLIKDQNEKKAVALATDIDITYKHWSTITMHWDQTKITRKQQIADRQCGMIGKIYEIAGVGFLSKYLIRRSGC